MDKFAWADLQLQILDCTKCALSESRINPIFGDGSEKAKIFIIAEGPGEEEDKQGRAFVGKSGKLLDKILEACNFNRDEHVFISNVVKCHPPENRDPKLEEKETCLPYLIQQIELLDPKIIIILGRVALQSLVDPNASITRMRGHWTEWNGRLLMPTYHPSALLRNPALKKDAWDDFRKVFYKYREVVNPDHQSQHISLDDSVSE